MSLLEAGTDLVHLKPGELLIADRPCLISTLLGSCVAITLFSPDLKSGAICHALLPSCPAPGHGACPERFRHVECAIRAMLEGLRRRGIACGRIEAKVFGGADMFRADSRFSVGRQNVAKSWDILRGEGVRIAAFDVGGTRGRKIIFSPHTGEVLLKRLNGVGAERGAGEVR